ncbi:acetyl-CoA hydrolase/transferase C-terminal domain-containing protein [Actinomadura chibensis]|uniref:acetyl-CoA hydrolase/transferase C-terminal domain-containing protein n=1 Tax=Actinomadura chibensis TaxID=392828 RepID=UPI0020D0A4E4|nr:acetyl-CoA hydrolase/transferase C-terminal domain-containing protein [Actinomadura chibensis]
MHGWAEHNERVRMLHTEESNDPGLIARRLRLISALQVDLYAQASASRVPGVVYSGFDTLRTRRHRGPS